MTEDSPKDAPTTYNPCDVKTPFVLIPLWLLSKSLLPSALLLYGLLRKYAGTNGFCWVGVKRLAEDMGFSERQVKRLIRHLVKENVIVREERFSSTTLTRFVDPTPPDKGPKPVSLESLPSDWDDLSNGTQEAPKKEEATPYKYTQKTNVKNAVATALKPLPPVASVGPLAGSAVPLPPPVAESLVDVKVDPDPTVMQGDSEYLLNEVTQADYFSKFALAAHPKIVKADATKIVLKHLFIGMSVVEAMAVIAATKQYAKIVEPLKDIPKAWNYVIGSFSWFKDKRWQEKTPAQVQAWVDAEIMKDWCIKKPKTKKGAA
ncbi:MAG: hypothetical protein BroJett014_03930 [Planctomycetota bacterium]|nr:MAG: hypothetical protein BroJett014_03930 [Planctomycetota bacterium]